MGKIKFSVVTTVLNEEESICPLIDTLINQSTPPIEIIIIDAGSSDNTVELIRQRMTKSDVPIRCLYLPKSNRSQARNEGVRQAKSEYIAVTDAGCEADIDWLKNLALRFEDGVEAVGGFYLPKIDQPIQELFSKFTCVSNEEFDSRIYLPSSRSLAFTKSAWEEVGGYPENLETCEDLVFAKKLFDGQKMKATNKAIVYWRQPNGLGAYFNQISGYAKGDIEAFFVPHVKRIISVWFRYIVFILLPPLFLVYAAYVLTKFRINPLYAERAAMTFMVQVVTDWAVMTGSLRGLRGRTAL